MFGCLNLLDATKNMITPFASQLPFVIVGAGGHASVVAASLRAMSAPIRGMTDRDRSRTGSTAIGVPILGDDGVLERLGPDAVHLANGIGVQPRSGGSDPPDPGTAHRRLIFIRLTATAFYFPPIVHPSAVIADAAEIANGAQIMAGAVIQPRTVVGENAVVNSSASIDHDCRIEAHAFIAPGVVLCGDVSVGAGTFIGAGAVILPGVSIGENALVGAGAIVRGDIGDRQFGI